MKWHKNQSGLAKYISRILRPDVIKQDIQTWMESGEGAEALVHALEPRVVLTEYGKDGSTMEGGVGIEYRADENICGDKRTTLAALAKKYVRTHHEAEGNLAIIRDMDAARAILVRDYNRFRPEGAPKL